MSPDIVSVTLRAAGFVNLFQAAGIAFFLAQFLDRLTHAGTCIRRPGLVAASGGVLLLLAHHDAEATRMADDFSDLFDWDLQRLSPDVSTRIIRTNPQWGSTGDSDRQITVEPNGPTPSTSAVLRMHACVI